jgi:hypothetical protein
VALKFKLQRLSALKVLVKGGSKIPKVSVPKQIMVVGCGKKASCRSRLGKFTV